MTFDNDDAALSMADGDSSLHYILCCPLTMDEKGAVGTNESGGYRNGS